MISHRSPERKTLFIIPARGGSKGFPGKNLVPLAGIPLVGRSARLARRAAAALGCFSRVVCSTDDPAIAELAATWGAEVPFVRPPGLAADGAATMDVVLHALDVLADVFDEVVLLQPTSPLTEAEDVVAAVRMHRETQAPVVSVCRTEHPVQWLYYMAPDGRLIPAIREAIPHQRQAARPTFCPNGAVYVASPETLRKEKSFIAGSFRGLLMPPERSPDIDSPFDLIVADAFLEARPIPHFEVAGTGVGPGKPCYIIAEAGVNHNGDVAMALKLVDAAAAAGANAVKFQTFKAEKVISRAAPKAEYQIRNTGTTESQYEMAKRLELSPSDFRKLAEHSAGRGITFLSSPFDMDSVQLLEDLDVAAFKVGSGELTNHDLLERIGQSKRPVLLSTGMSVMVEVHEAVDLLARCGNPPLALFHCVSNYPAAVSECNLAAVDTLRRSFGVPVGWSDHTIGTHIALAAAARGAHLIEKHFTLDRKLPGPDHLASVEPDEFGAMVRAIREAEAAVGTGEKRRCASEENTATVARRSIHAAREIAEGRLIEREDLVLLRPGSGIPANQISKVVGRRATRTLPEGEPLTKDSLEDWP